MTGVPQHQYAERSARRRARFHQPRERDRLSQPAGGCADRGANATLDIAQRKPLYHQLYQALADDPPVILLGNREILSASSARVTGFKPDIYNGLVGSLPNVKPAP